MREDARQRHDPRRLRQSPDETHRPGAVPRRKLDRLLDGVGRRRRFDEPLQIGHARHFGEASLVEARLKAILESHHQLDAFERAQAQFVERRRRRSPHGRARIARSATRESRRSASRPASRPLAPSRGSRFASVCACPRCAAVRYLARPTRCECADGPAAARWPRGSPLRHRSRDRRRARHAPAPARPRSRRRQPTRVRRLLVEHALDVLGKDVESVGRDDHFLLAALDEQTPLLVALADVAGVQPALRVEDAVASGVGAWEWLGVGRWALGLWLRNSRS